MYRYGDKYCYKYQTFAQTFHARVKRYWNGDKMILGLAGIPPNEAGAFFKPFLRE